MNQEFKISVTQADEYVLSGFIRMSEFTPTFLTPFFKKNNLNPIFVQSLESNFKIEAFCEYFIDDIEYGNLISYHQKDVFRLREGDAGILAAILPDRVICAGQKEDFLREIVKSTKNMILPAFFNLEISYLIGNERRYKSAITTAAASFANETVRNCWELRETQTKSGKLESFVEDFFATSETFKSNKNEKMSKAALAKSWARVVAHLQKAVGDVEYRTWMKEIEFSGFENGEVRLELPTRFLRDRVEKEYGVLITALWQAENIAIKRMKFAIKRVKFRAVASSRGEATNLVETKAQAAIGRAAVARPESATPLDPRFTFETFVVGKPNEFAYACAKQVANTPAKAGFNPLFLYGGAGLGKTHLMHAIAWELFNQRRNGRPVSVTYMSAEKFMYRFIDAMRNQSTLEFKNELRSVDVLIIDDVQFLIGKDNTQEEFFHTFNALVDTGKQIVISADKSPSDLSGLEDVLRTRLGCGMVVDLHAATYELRLSVLHVKANRAGVDVPAKVMEFLAHKITSNIRELEGALNRLIAHANLFDRPITLETAHEVLDDVLKAFERRVTIQEIQKRVADHWSIRVTEMSSARRSRNIALPRQVAMYLAKQLTQKSLPDIGRHFGDRDHTTVMHAVSRVTARMANDAAFAEDVELLRRLLET